MESQVITSFEIPTCIHRLAMGGQTESQVDASRRKWDASHKKAISVQPYTRAHTSENDTETDLRILTLDGQTMKNLRQLVCEFELLQIDCKSSQVIASARK